MIAGIVVGAVLLAVGLLLAWLAFGTSALSAFTPSGRPQLAETLTGMAVWALALIAPAAFILTGATKLASTALSAAHRGPRATPASRLAHELGDEYVVAAGLRLPDGRPIPELVLGPFGAAVIAELPRSELIRRRGQSWELRGPRGAWLPMESPLERAARDADRVRRWFGDDERDFIVKVYAAVVTTDGTLARTPTCAVIRPDQVGAWLRSLAPQRSLTPARRKLLVDLVHDLHA